MSGLKAAMQADLLGNILPFWINHAQDMEKGGCYGKIHNDLTIERDAPKGAILHTRILYTFSAASRMYPNAEYRTTAQRFWEYIRTTLWDPEWGGLYWTVDSGGKPLDERKQTYVQAFGIYAFSEYFAATGDAQALDLAILLFKHLEQSCFDPVHGGYFEACDRAWQQQDFYLDQKCGREKKSMNTMQHVVEAYTNLYRVWKDEKLARQLESALRVMLDRIVDPASGHFKLFFDERWNSLSDDCSYGHDIEGSWLSVEAAEALGGETLLEKTESIALRMAQTTLTQGLDEQGAILYEGGPEGVRDTDRHWWPQAEGVVGFVNAYQLTGRQEFLQAAERVWRYIDRHLIDHTFGEWYWGVHSDLRPMQPDAKVDIWKCPYHNGRACMQIVQRL